MSYADAGPVRHGPAVTFDTLQLRHADHGRRRFAALVAPFNVISYLVRPPERFSWKCWEKGLQRRGGQPVPLLREHRKTDDPIGHLEAFRSEHDGLHAIAVIADNPGGNRALEGITTGSLRALSVGFWPVSHWDDPTSHVRTVTEAELAEVSLVNVAAYGAAGLNPEPLTDPHPALTAARAALERDAANYRSLKLQVQYADRWGPVNR